MPLVGNLSLTVTKSVSNSLSLSFLWFFSDLFCGINKKKYNCKIVLANIIKKLRQEVRCGCDWVSPALLDQPSGLDFG